MSFTKLSESELVSNLENKNILIIGGTAGIGKALTLSLLKRNANVTIVGRRTPDETLSKAKFIKKDLTLLKDADNLGKELDLEIYDIIVFTNGIISGDVRKETDEKIEIDLSVSYLSRLAISKHFGKFLKRNDKTRKTRIFNMGYPGVKNEATVDDFNSEKNYKALPAHMNTVVGNEAVVNYWHTDDYNVYGLNPGLIQTEIREGFLGKGTFMSWIVEGLIGLLCQSTDQYSENVLVHLLASPEYENKSKTLFDNSGKILEPNPWLLEGDHAKRVIEESEKLLKKVLSN